MSIGIIIIVTIFLALVWWWFIGRNSPKYPPLEIDENDPLMIEAMTKAKSTANDFLKLLAGDFSEAQVKVPFTSSTGVVEHLWAEVLENENGRLSVRYLTPPVTHEVKLSRLHKHEISEIEDWVIILNDGKIHGGFTQRVMFRRGREQWGQLPLELAEQESKYVT